MKIIYITILGILAFTGFVMASSRLEEQLLIVEIQTGSSMSASEEFIEIYNPSHKNIDLENWFIEYKSANGTDWLKKVELSGIIAPRGRYLISTKNYLTDIADEFMSSGLSGTGGNIRIVKYDEEIAVSENQISWGDAQSLDTLVYQAPSGGQTLKRTVDEDGYFLLEILDEPVMFVSSLPSPSSDIAVISEPPKETQPKEEAKNNKPKTSASTISRAVISATNKVTSTNYKILITELMIDPDKPLIDAEDEYVEIYNPNKFTVNVAGYKLKSGSKLSYQFDLPNLELKAGQYKAIYSIDSGLTLSNAEGKARIEAPGGYNYETDSYTGAKPNNTWAVDNNGTWSWSARATPNEPNTFDASVAGISSGETAKESVNLRDEGPSYGTGSATQNDDDSAESENNTDELSNTNWLVLVAVAVLGLIYAGYEYRKEIRNALTKLAGSIKTGKDHRRQS